MLGTRYERGNKKTPSKNGPLLGALYKASTDIEAQFEHESIMGSMTKDEADRVILDETRKEQALRLQGMICENDMDRLQVPDYAAGILFDLKSNSRASGPGPYLVLPDFLPPDVVDFGIDTNMPVYDPITDEVERKYAKIVDFVKKRQFTLAFVTQHFPMAGHVMYAHMKRAGFKASYEDFRYFLHRVGGRENGRQLFM